MSQGPFDPEHVPGGEGACPAARFHHRRSGRNLEVWLRRRSATTLVEAAGGEASGRSPGSPAGLG